MRAIASHATGQRRLGAGSGRSPLMTPAKPILRGVHDRQTADLEDRQEFGDAGDGLVLRDDDRCDPS